jgi:CHASE3 domain sensor protein
MRTMRGSLLPALLGCLIIGGASYQIWQFERTAIDLHTNADRLTRQYAALEMAVADLRAAQAGYVAAGQNPSAWMGRVDELTTQVEAVLAERQRVGHPDAITPLAAAQTRLDALRTSDQRARRYVGNDQFLMASDVVFVESLNINGRLATEITTARDTEHALNRQEAATIRQYQLGLAGGTVLLLLVLVVVPRSRGSDVPEFRSPEVPESRGPEVPESRGPEVPGSRGSEVPAAQSLKITEAADVCVDIARLLDGRDLPALISRTAAAIGATGVVLWVIDDARETLRASLGHGYSDKMLTRLGTLSVTADNVTSVACRTLQPQVVPSATAGGSGALAVPLIGTSGCVGVLAAEVSGPASDGSTLPLARVIAAQLAAVITPLPAVTASADTPPAAEAR